MPSEAFLERAREWLVRAQGYARPEHEESLARLLEETALASELSPRERALLAAAKGVLEDARDQGRDDCLDDLVDEMLIERLRKAVACYVSTSEVPIMAAKKNTAAKPARAKVKSPKSGAPRTARAATTKKKPAARKATAKK